MILSKKSLETGNNFLRPAYKGQKAENNSPLRGTSNRKDDYNDKRTGKEDDRFGSYGECNRRNGQ